MFWSHFETYLAPCPAEESKDTSYTFRLDPFMKSTKINMLTSRTFRDYIRDKNVALVLFYDSSIPQKKKENTYSTWTMAEFVKAAENTERIGHGFATVDCAKDRQLCYEEDMTCIFPRLKLYSSGEPVGVVSTTYNLSYKQMKGMVETVPARTIA